MIDRPALNQGRTVAASNRWDDTSDRDADRNFKRLSREDVAALRAQELPVSPWRVVATQVAVGVVAALVGWLITRRPEVAWSMLYGAAVVVVPGALMARGMTSRLSSMSPAASAVSVLLWSTVKMLVSVAMLLVASRVVQPLVWPALLIGLVLCIKIYVVALLWRHRRSN